MRCVVQPDSDALDGMQVGSICVRGAPTFLGYENNEDANRESFFEDGYFNTGILIITSTHLLSCTIGDNGYLDKDGYLFLSGRSKEVINRGGEIISPFEIEEVIVELA